MTSRPLIYVECDIPAGMTVREWRSQRARPVRRARLIGLLLRGRSRRGRAVASRVAVV